MSIDPASYPDILEAAADILESEQVGWCQGSYFNSGPIFRDDSEQRKVLTACALGALRLAMYENWRDVSAFKIRELTVENQPMFSAEDQMDRLIVQYLRRNGFQCHGTAGYNDSPARTKEEVIDALKGTAKDLRNQADVDNSTVL